jgi:ankyrin repeat protein
MSVSHQQSTAHTEGAALLSFAKYIETGNTKQVIDFLGKAKFDINARWPNGHTPLELACTLAHLEIIEALVEANAQVNTTNHKYETPLFFCVNAQMGNPPEAVRYLLSQKADPNHERADGWSPLCLAACSGNVPIIESLLQYKADLEMTNLTGASPVYLAAEKDHAAAIRVLAREKANVNKVDISAISPLVKASTLGCENAVEALLTLKADLNVPAGSASAVTMAVSRNRISVAKRLLAANADVNGPPELNPLYFACKLDNTDLVIFLLVEGAALISPNDRFSNPVNMVLEEAKENLAVIVTTTKFLLAEAEKIKITSEGRLDRRFYLYLDNRLNEMEHFLERKKGTTMGEVGLNDLINEVKKIKLRLNPPSLRHEAMAYVLTYGKSSSAPEKSAPLSSSSFTLHAPPQAEAAVQPAEPTAEPVGVAAQSSSSATPERNLIKY